MDKSLEDQIMAQFDRKGEKRTTEQIVSNSEIARSTCGMIMSALNALVDAGKLVREGQVYIKA